jgi:copper homeostasis protein
MSRKSSRVQIEVCADSAEGCEAAQGGGADRVELVASLAEGGLTPSLGAIEVARASSSIPLVVMIRPRGGDFLYSDHEVAAMERDILLAKELDAAGVALGVLRADGAVDRERTRQLVELARPLEVCFHRAFDMTRDPMEALETLIALGVDRVLTSGQSASALEGIDCIASLVRAARGRIEVMAGGGVRAANVRRIADASGVSAVHTSARGRAESEMVFRNLRCTLSSGSPRSEYERAFTDASSVRRIVDALR